jgi:hypothetical protein
MAAGPAFGADLGQTVRGLAVGQVVFQRYTLKRILGRGGMGIVWLAQDDKLARDVALKFVPDMLFLDPAARDDLKRETRRSLELTHPNIVRIHDFTEDEYTAAISMEYVDGMTLSQMRVQRSAKCFEPAEIEPWLSGLCAALDYAHSAVRMVHHDLKPANLMLNGRGAIKVTDFGIACSLMNSVARVSMYASSGGTLVYMSPQQMKGAAPSHLDDIYALGATLYELLTGKPPFHSGDITLQVRESEPEPMTARRRQLESLDNPVPTHWEETIGACLAKDPARRPQSAGEVLERLSSPAHSFPGGYECTAATIRMPARPVAVSPAVGLAQPLQARTISLPWLKRLAIPVGPVALAACVAAYCLHGQQKPIPAATSAPVAVAPAVTVQPAVSPAPGPQAPGGLMITTVPAGAMVQLGGEAAENAPAIFKAIPAGKYPVRIIMPGYETVELNAEIKPNEFTDLGTVTMLHSTGSLQVISSPPEGSFVLTPQANGAAQSHALITGKIPQTVRNLPTGTYTLTFKQDGWPDHEQTVNVTRNAILPVEWDFPSGMLRVDSTPAGAQVYEQDRLLGLTPLLKAVAPGAYPALRVVMAGMVPVALTATVADGQSASLTAGTLQPVVTAVQLTSEPAGLQYVITGTAGDLVTGTTPASMYNLPAGDYQATLKRDGWQNFTVPFHLAPKAPVTIDHSFPEGTVTITSTPPGASIFVGTRLLGTAPVTVSLPPGDTELSAKLTGMSDRVHPITITGGEETTLAFNMKSGESSAVHHHHHLNKPTPSPLVRLGDSIKSFFAGGAASKSKTTER